jgi:hypothetical protein
MNTLQKRIFSAVAIVAVIGLASYWYWSPYLAIRQLRNAAVDADAERFNEHVDFPKLRDSLKEQFSARIGKEMGDRPTSGGELERAGNAFGSMLALALADKMIDAAVRPETIMFAMREGKFRVEHTGQQDGQGQDRTRKDLAWRTERKGVDQVLFHVEGKGGDAGKEKMALVMQREGFANWKLTDIRLP